MTRSIATRLAAVLALGTLCTAGLARAAEPVAATSLAYASLASAAESRPARADAGPAVPAACAGQAWPHLDRACLTAADGTPARGPVRTVGFGR